MAPICSSQALDENFLRADEAKNTETTIKKFFSSDPALCWLKLFIELKRRKRENFASVRAIRLLWSRSLFDFPHRQTINSTVRHSRPDSSVRSRSENFSAVLEKEKKNFPSRLATSLRLIQSALSFFGLQFRDTKAIAWAKNKIFSVSKYTPTTSLTLQRAFFGRMEKGKRSEKNYAGQRAKSHRRDLVDWQRNLAEEIRLGRNSSRSQKHGERVFQRGTSRRTKKKPATNPTVYVTF